MQRPAISDVPSARHIQDNTMMFPAVLSRSWQLPYSERRRPAERRLRREKMVKKGASPIRSDRPRSNHCSTAIEPCTVTGKLYDAVHIHVWNGTLPSASSKNGRQIIAASDRRLLIIGSSAAMLAASRRGAPKGSWLEQMMARKPRMLVTVELVTSPLIFQPD